MSLISRAEHASETLQKLAAAIENKRLDIAHAKLRKLQEQLRALEKEMNVKRSSA